MIRRGFWQAGLSLVAAATFAMAFKGIFARLIYQHGVSVNALLIWRFALAVPLFWLGGMWLLRRNPAPAGGLGHQQWALCAGTGLLFFISAWCDFHAIESLGASLSRMLLDLFPAMVRVLQAVERRRWPEGRSLLIFTGAWIGIALVLMPGWHGGTVNPAGLAYGFGAALCYALFWRASQSLMKPLGSVRFNQLSNSFTLVAMLVFLLPGVPLQSLWLPAPALGWMLVMVVFSTVVPFFLMFEGIRRTDTSRAGVVSMFGPVVTVLAAITVFPDEHLGPVQWLGMALVLASIAMLKSDKKPKPA